MKIDKIVARLKQWAQDNYENGADTFVECYSDSDWATLIQESGGTLGGSLKFAKRLAAIYRERQSNARIEGGF